MISVEYKVKMGISKLKSRLSMIGFKKCNQPHNKGAINAKESKVCKNKYVRLDQNAYNHVVTELLPDKTDVNLEPHQNQFRLLRPRKGTGAFVDYLARTEANKW